MQMEGCPLIGGLEYLFFFSSLFSVFLTRYDLEVIVYASSEHVVMLLYALPLAKAKQVTLCVFLTNRNRLIIGGFTFDGTRFEEVHLQGDFLR